MTRSEPATAALVAALVVACSAEPERGPVAVHWDRDACEHCLMSIGDRRAAAQVRHPDRPPARKFDDLGCALLWLDEHGWAGQPGVELWVRDAAGEHWIDGFAARYRGDRETPMGYGYTAADTKAALPLGEVWQRIRMGEDERGSPAR